MTAVVVIASAVVLAILLGAQIPPRHPSPDVPEDPYE